MNKNKIINAAMIALLLVLGIGGCTYKKNVQRENKVVEVQDISDAQVDITVMDIGKADCILIKLQDNAIMIDTGLDKYGADIVDRLKENNIDTLEYLILTHMDKDHIGSADKIIDNIKINNLIQADYIKESKQYSEYEESLKKNNINPVRLHTKISTEINGVQINIYPAENDYYKQSNDYSIIVELKYGNYNFLFAGDAEDERLKEFLKNNNTQYTFVKMPHHGKCDSLSEAFVKSTLPSYAAITCSEEALPDEELLNILKKSNVKTYLTSEGELNIKTDGQFISFSR